MAYEKPTLLDDSITTGGNQTYGTVSAASIAINVVGAVNVGVVMYVAAVYVAAVASEVTVTYGHGGK